MNNIEYGKLRVINEVFLFNDLVDRNSGVTFILINFDSKSSVKIIPFFNEIKSKELNTLIGFFAKYGINIRLNDLLGKLHVVVLKMLLEEKGKLVVLINDIGLTYSSIDFLVSNFNIFMGRLENKLTIICPKLIC